MRNAYPHRAGILRRLWTGLAVAVLVLFALYDLAPLVVMVSTSLKSADEIRSGALLSLPDEIDTGAWAYAWGTACIGATCRGLAPYFVNSVAIAVPAVAISSVLGALNGYALTKWRFRGADLIFALMLFGTFLPYQAILLPLAQTLGALGLGGTRGGLIVAHTAYGLTFTTLFFRNYFVGISDDVVKAALLDGAGFFRIFGEILLPPAIPILAVTVIWQFTQVWNDFLFGSALTWGESLPVTVALINLVNVTTGLKHYNVDMAGAIITGLPTLVVYVLAGKYFIRGLIAGAVKG